MLTETQINNTEVIEDQDLYNEVVGNILRNVNRNVDQQKGLPNKMARLLSMKWFLENEKIS